MVHFFFSLLPLWAIIDRNKIRLDRTYSIQAFFKEDNVVKIALG